MVLVVAGYDREDTMTVAKEWKGLLIDILSTKNAYRDITSRQVNGKMNIGTDFVLLDVRTKAEYEGARLEGAVNIPLHKIMRRYEELDKDKVIIVYCHSGRRSAIATQMLQNLGFEKVYNMEGGIISWEKEFGEEKMVFPQPIAFSEGRLEIWSYQSAKVGDALVRYLQYGGGGCGTGTSYQIFVSRVIDGREIDEGNVWYMDPDLPEDITEDLHEKTDALDDYSIQVKRWSDSILLILEKKGG
ncbi:MAG: rhodanese-like domain-containing protein [Candidatus Hydrothermarchaeales archaeon]